jgi:integrase
MNSKEWAEKNRSVKKWLNSVSKSTRKQYRLGLKRFIDFHKISIKDFLEEAKSDITEAQDRINEWYNFLREEKEKTHNYAKFCQAVVKSFLLYHGIEAKTPKRKSPRKYKRAVLRREHIKKLVEAAQYPRDKALIMLAFQTGMSISDMLSLDYGQIKDAIENEKTHHVINNIREKAGTESISVIGEDAITLLKKYIEWKTQTKHKFTDNSPLFVRIRDNGKKDKRLTVRTAQYMMRETIVKTGLTTFEELKKFGKFNPYGFHAIRKAFSSIAKTQGIPEVQVELSMGHALSYNGAYDEFQDAELIENFKNAEAHLSIYKDIVELEEKTKQMRDDFDELKRENEELRKEIELLKKILVNSNQQ